MFHVAIQPHESHYGRFRYNLYESLKSRAAKFVEPLGGKNVKFSCLCENVQIFITRTFFFQLLQLSPAARLALEDVLNHEWITSNTQKSS